MLQNVRILLLSTLHILFILGGEHNTTLKTLLNLALYPTKSNKLIIYSSNIQHFCGYIKQLPSLDDKNNKIRKVVTRKHSRDGTDEDV